MTQYIYNGKEISHTSFISLCMSNGINGGRKMSFYEKLVQMAEQGNERAKNIMANLEVREVETPKKQEEPSLHSPKNRYHVEVHFPEPLENLGSVVSFGTMNLDGIDNYIRRYWMYGQPTVHVIIRENLKTYPQFDWKEVRNENLNA